LGGVGVIINPHSNSSNDFSGKKNEGFAPSGRSIIANLLGVVLKKGGYISAIPRKTSVGKVS